MMMKNILWRVRNKLTDKEKSLCLPFCKETEKIWQRNGKISVCPFDEYIYEVIFVEYWF